MFKENDQLRAYHNIDIWHEQGYDGSIINVGTAESLDFSSLTDWEKEHFKNNDGVGTRHGLDTAKAFWEVSKSTIYKLPKVDSNEFLNTDLSEITLMYQSLSINTYSNTYKEYLKQNEHFSSFASAGNDGSMSDGARQNDIYTSIIGAGYLSNGKAYMESYSSTSPYMDFSVLTNWYTDHNSNGIPDKFTGTSCACPVFVGMCSLVQHLFKVKTGSVLTYTNLYKFVKDHCKDIINPYGYDELEGGWDKKSGWGIFILPNPQDIILEDYMEEKKYPADLSDWAKKGYDFVITKGISDGTRPKDLVTREEFWTMLERYANE